MMMMMMMMMMIVYSIYIIVFEIGAPMHITSATHRICATQVKDWG